VADYEVEYSPSYAGELRMPLSTFRCCRSTPARSLPAVLRLSCFPALLQSRLGYSTGIANVGAEEGILDEVCFTNETGPGRRRARCPAAMPARPQLFAIIDQPISSTSMTAAASTRLPVVPEVIKGMSICSTASQCSLSGPALHQHHQNAKTVRVQRHFTQAIRDRMA